MYDYSRQESLYLVGVPQSGCCGLDAPNCCFKNALLLRENSNGTTKITMKFPSNELITGLDRHAGDLEFYVFGMHCSRMCLD
jgi:hypothetical protein